MALLLFFQSLPAVAVAHIVWAFGDLSQHFAATCNGDRNSVYSELQEPVSVVQNVALHCFP